MAPQPSAVRGAPEELVALPVCALCLGAGGACVEGRGRVEGEAGAARSSLCFCVCVCVRVRALRAASAAPSRLELIPDVVVL